MKGRGRKPNILWLEGVLTKFDAPFPYADAANPLRLGFSVGQQIVGLYLAEMLLKYALDHSGVPHGQHHNLHELFRNLPRPSRRAVERKYTEILNRTTDWTWDVGETVDSLLRFLGQNAITDTRYFWEPGRTHIAGRPILFAPSMIAPLIHALFIVLHNHPSAPITKQYDTTFLSRAESIPSQSLVGKGMKPDVVWLGGVLDFLNASFPNDDPDDPRRLGFSVSQQIVGLYIAEMLLKYALDHSGVSYDPHHNLHRLFIDLPEAHRGEVERKYTELLNSVRDWTWDVGETVDSLLRFLGQNAITDTRYFWEPGRTHIAGRSILFEPSMIIPLIHALFIVLHNCPSEPIKKRYDTIFRSLAGSYDLTPRPKPPAPSSSDASGPS